MNGFRKRSDAGAMVENRVFIRLRELSEDLRKINFWRTKMGAEVDFVLHDQGNVIPIEVKYSKFEKPDLSRSFLSFLNDFRPERGVVLTQNYWDMTERDGCKILFAPVCYL